jgi:hypothetical protein
MAFLEISRRRLAGSALAAVMTLGLPSVVHAQSTDPNHPAPLGPGVNRGNVDNSGKGHTFYFYAGPGHIDVEMAFEEMGLFGAPLRQTMNFDLYNDDNSLASHNAIVSQGALARNHTDGDLPARQRFRLVVTAQQGAIRLGGYYEIEVKGAVTFDGPTLGVGVRPVLSEKLVK